ncbi:MAG: NAD(P)H-binding protein, partial [Flammeovirgaceae bacterium]
DGNYTSNKRLIEFAKNKDIKKFVLLSSTHVRRPYSYITLTININKNNMQWWKVMAEKCLRESGMKYLIVRPVGLIIDKEKEHEKSAFTISQGDTVEGKIYRSTVGNLVIDTLLDE